MNDKVKVTHKSLLGGIGFVIVDNIDNLVHWKFGDCARNYLDDIDKDKLKQLSDHVIDWMNANIKQPEFYDDETIEDC